MFKVISNLVVHLGNGRDLFSGNCYRISGKRRQIPLAAGIKKNRAA
jgi:hypothetical protein